MRLLLPGLQSDLGSLWESSSIGLFVKWILSWLTLKLLLRLTYMELPQGIQTKTGNSKDPVLKLLKNIYGQKQTGRVWNSYLVDKLTSLGYTASLIDDCVFYHKDIIFMVYVDNGIFLGKNDKQLKVAICEIHECGLNIEDQGHPADYVGVNIKKRKDES
jgi:hypothetical protein